jgi:tRNA 2-selenouridine synthase
MPISLTDFLTLRRTLPVIDVRSEGEYADGHIPSACNIPLLNNAERSVVGTTYKTSGQREAIREGFRLVGPRLNEMVLAAESVAVDKEALVHCWRGGMRSSNFASFIGMVGIQSHVLEGGYKTYRQAALDRFRKPLRLLSITGCTGSGKSDLLRELARRGEQVIDLEAMACHKGSAFGGLLQPPQPTTEQFQNDLYECLISLDYNRRIWVEDESIAIGKIFLPSDFWAQLNTSPMIRIDVPKEIRVQRLTDEYGAADRTEFLATMAKVSKKLGGQHFNDAREKLFQGDMPAVIDILLTYYDKAYTQSMERRISQQLRTLTWDGKDLGCLAAQLTPSK